VAASETENPDLFWALHGGGGNLGVATSLTFRLHPLPVATLALLLWPPTHGLDVTGVYRDVVDAGAPDEFGGAVAYITGPPLEIVPEHLQGTLCSGVVAMYAGTEAETREVLAPLLALEPEGVMIEEMPYAEIQSALDDPPGFRNYWSVEHLSAFPDEAVERFCVRAGDMIAPSPSQHLAMPWGGAVARDAADWPQPHRGSHWVVHPLGLWTDPADDERGIAWARGLCADMKPFSTGAVYLNFVGDEGQDRVVAGFGKDNYDRLARLKGEWDPANVFHLNQNIKPA
jgi:FAD/FMN-containing dehydrogenase